MSNSEFMNMNNNEEAMDATENCVSNSEDCTNKALKSKSFAKITKENLNTNVNLSNNVKESDSQNVFFGIAKSMSSLNENNTNIFSNKEIFESGSNENCPLDIQREDKCLKCQHGCQHKENHQVSKATSDTISFGKGNISNGENKSDNANFFVSEDSSNDECLSTVASQSDKNSTDLNDDVSLEIQFDKPQLMSYNFNVVPNPNEFGLVGKSNLSQQNSDVFDVSKSTTELLAFSDNSIVISNSNAIPQSDSIVSSNYSLSQLQQYISDDDDDDSLIEELPVAPQQYREGDRQMEDSDDDSDSSTSSSTSILISDSSSDSESEDEYENFNNKPVSNPVKAKGEIVLSDLPPIEDLTISVPEDACIRIGKIYQIVDQLVIVQADKDTPAYDLDTVLFTQDGRPLGSVFDVMGPVTEPYYCIRFNSKDHIKEKNVTLDQIVYAAPKTQYSKFVFLAQLMQLKGSDASWENDVEPPEIYLDYSDDEQEQRAKKKFYRNKKAISKTDSDPDEPARKKHSAYVKRMNARNLRLTAARGNHNSNKSKAENGNILWQPNLQPMVGSSPSAPRAGAPCHQMFGRPPLFDMRVPQPNPPFPSGGPGFHRPEFSFFPQMFSGPSTSSRAQGPSPFPRHCTSAGPSPFPRHCNSPGPGSLFSRSCVTPGPPFPRPGASSGLPPFPRPSNGPRVPTFSPPAPYGRLPSNQGLGSSSSGWNSSFPKSDNPWASPFPPPPPRRGPPPPRNTPPPPFGSFPFSLDFPTSFPIGASPPQGPQTNISPQWATQMNNRGNSPQFNFNPSVPPPSPNFSQN